MVLNFDSLIDEENSGARRAGFGWDNYYDLPDIYNWLDEQLAKYPEKLTGYEYGKSYENRTLRAVKLSNKKVSNQSLLFSSFE